MIRKIIGAVLILMFVLPNAVRADEICIGNKGCYDIKVSQSAEEHKKGLMFVYNMPENQGMLFDFRGYNTKGLAMWMKNTFISLDMLFIGCDGVLKDIYKNAKPHSEELIKSDTDFCYVLEINGKEADKKGFTVNDKVDIDFSFMSYLKAFWNGVY